MRISLAFVVALLSACGSVQSPDNCCISEADCAAIKSEVVIPCDDGQVCNADHACVQAQCETSEDCDAAAPICQLGFCTATCAIDDDCADVAGRTHCSPGGSCVGCVDSTQCSGDTNICDAEDSVCRGCERDTECASGVCIEAEGTCAVEADILYVLPNGNDTGTCTRTAPCLTIAYAYSKVLFGTTRNVIRVEGGTSDVVTPITVQNEITIDGTGTTIRKPTNNPIFSVNAALTVEGITLQTNAGAQDAMVKVGNGTFRTGPSTNIEGIVEASSGTVVLDRARVKGQVSCTNGTVDIDRSTFDEGADTTNNSVNSSNCQLSVRRSTFIESAEILSATGGKVVIENNLFMNTYEYADSIYVVNSAPGSVYRFNTIANLSGIDSSGVALYCDGTLKVTSNVFAYRSDNPFASNAGCRAEYSIFDDVYTPPATPPEHSMFVPFNSLFTDPVAKDFTLSAASAAKGAADPAITDVLTDHDGNARPNPAGGAADAGAFEAP